MSFDEVRVGGYLVSGLVQIGEGGFGLIYTCHDARGTQYALKKCSIQRQETFNTVQKEVNMLKRFKDCQYIVTIMGELVSMANGALILLEWCAGGHLLDKLNKMDAAHSAFNTREVCRIFGQVLTAMNVLHTARPRFVVHRDIKCENILFGGPSGEMVKLCDFGSCVEGVTPLRDVAERTTAEEIIGKETTLAYRAPEMVDLYMRNYLNEKTDIWALGCVLYCIVYLQHPFQEQGALAILNGANIPATMTREPRRPVDENLRIIIGRTLDIDMEARPTCAQLLDAMRAIESGQRLPPYDIPQEAKDKKIERAEAAKRRAEKNKQLESQKRGMAAIIANKKATLANAPASTASASQSSVAAKRLAQIRGGPVTVGGLSAGNSSSTAAAGGVDTAFDFFVNSSDLFTQPSSASSSAALDMGSPKYLTPTSGSDDDDFFQTFPGASTVPATSSANAFGETGTSAASNDFFGATASSGSMYVPPAPSGFNEFDSFTPTGFAESFAPSTSAAASAINTDAFGDDSFAATTSSPRRTSFTSLPSPPPSNRNSVSWPAAPVASAWPPVAPASTSDPFMSSASSDTFASTSSGNFQPSGAQPSAAQNLFGDADSSVDNFAFSSSKAPAQSAFNMDDDLFGSAPVSPTPAFAPTAAMSSSFLLDNDTFSTTTSAPPSAVDPFASTASRKVPGDSSANVLSLFDGLSAAPTAGSAMARTSSGSATAMALDLFSPSSSVLNHNTPNAFNGLGGIGIGSSVGGAFGGSGAMFNQSFASSGSISNQVPSAGAGAGSSGTADMSSFLMAQVSAPLQRKNNAGVSNNYNAAGTTTTRGLVGGAAVLGGARGPGTQSAGPDPFANLLKF